VRRHSLTDTAFAALAAGRPDQATLTELRRAQRSRHLLLVREIIRTEPDTADRWHARLAADRHLVTDPLFGAWAAHHLRSGDAHRCAEQEPGHAHRCSEQEPGHARRCSEQEPGDAHKCSEQSGRTLTSSHDGLRIDVRLEDRDPRRALLGLAPTGRLTEAETEHWQRCLDEAWELLVGRHRADAEILTAVLDRIVPVRPDPAARGISATSADAYGVVAMSAPADGTALAVGLLHEVAHSVLNATQHLFDLHRHPGVLGYSPWRDDPRPASGILHGAYAYLAVSRFWRAEAAATGDRLATFEFARWREAVAEVAERLRAGDLTPAGVRFVTALRDEVGPWRAEPVDPDVARLARAANTDHRLRWRLRNLAVDPVDAAAAAAAWRAGERPPRVPSRLVPAPRRALESSARLDLVHGALRGDPPPGGRPTAGDTAFVRGDYGTARRAYSEGLDWTGLALTVPIEGRLEAIVSAYRLLGERPDPIAFAAWMND
jgi:hypothetical protein